MLCLNSRSVAEEDAAPLVFTWWIAGSQRFTKDEISEEIRSTSLSGAFSSEKTRSKRLDCAFSKWSNFSLMSLISSRADSAASIHWGGKCVISIVLGPLSTSSNRSTSPWLGPKRRWTARRSRWRRKTDVRFRVMGVFPLAFMVLEALTPKTKIWIRNDENCPYNTHH